MSKDEADKILAKFPKTEITKVEDLKEYADTKISGIKYIKDNKYIEISYSVGDGNEEKTVVVPVEDGPI